MRLPILFCLALAATACGQSAGNGQASAGGKGTPIEAAFLVDKPWADNGSVGCGYDVNLVEFVPDGRMLFYADGHVGSWRLEGDQLTITGNRGEATGTIVEATAIGDRKTLVIERNGERQFLGNCPSRNLRGL